MPRGGSRQGAPGTSYPNRRDLNAVKPLPVATGPSNVYGDSANLQRAQQAVPMAPPPTSVVAPGGGQPAPTAPTPIDLHAPSERPGEPITAGLPIGPGPGTEALGAAMAPTPQTLGDLLDRLAQSNPDLAYLQAQAARGWR